MASNKRENLNFFERPSLINTYEHIYKENKQVALLLWLSLRVQSCTWNKFRVELVKILLHIIFGRKFPCLLNLMRKCAFFPLLALQNDTFVFYICF